MCRGASGRNRRIIIGHVRVSRPIAPQEQRRLSLAPAKSRSRPSLTITSSGAALLSHPPLHFSSAADTSSREHHELCPRQQAVPVTRFLCQQPTLRLYMDPLEGGHCSRIRARLCLRRCFVSTTINGLHSFGLPEAEVIRSGSSPSVWFSMATDNNQPYVQCGRVRSRYPAGLNPAPVRLASRRVASPWREGSNP